MQNSNEMHANFLKNENKSECDGNVQEICISQTGSVIDFQVIFGNFIFVRRITSNQHQPDMKSPENPTEIKIEFNRDKTPFFENDFSIETEFWSSRKSHPRWQRRTSKRQRQQVFLVWFLINNQIVRFIKIQFQPQNEKISQFSSRLSSTQLNQSRPSVDNWIKVLCLITKLNVTTNGQLKISIPKKNCLFLIRERSEKEKTSVLSKHKFAINRRLPSRTRFRLFKMCFFCEFNQLRQL